MKVYRIALYLRLSKEEKPIHGQGESGSIQAQRRMLQSFVAENFTDYQLLEFCDDGYTGTNLSRPGLQRLLSMVKGLAVDCIVVKDFSRFSRDYIVLGSYLEQIFPFMGVRFISLNDHYDSENFKGNTGDIDVNFQGLLYDLYSKDLSRKVRASLAVRKEKGVWASGHCPFGYEKAPKDRHKLVVAGEEAKIVRRIFALAGEGKTSVQIARLFNEEKVKTPAQFQIEKGCMRRTPKGGIFLWSVAFICQMLRNPVYVGDLVYGKYEKEAVGGKNRLKPRKQWKILPDHHEPIVPRALFERVQARRGKHRPAQYRESHPLVGKLLCGCCKRNLQYRPGQDSYFFCPQKYSGAQKLCVQKVNVMYLEEYVLYKLQQKLSGDGGLERLRRELETETEDTRRALQTKEKEAAGECRRLRQEHLEAYQKFAFGETEAFHSKRTELQEAEQELQRLQEKLLELEKEPVKRSEPLLALSRETVDRYIQRIVIWREDDIEIVWKSDEEDEGVSMEQERHLKNWRGD